MTVRYVDGTNGNDSWDGLVPNFVSGTNGPKATLNGGEDSPVAASDLVHVRSGVYRELHTIDVSGTSGNPIEFRGDVAGIIWPPGGIVRITGSDDDQSATRNNIITATSKDYRTFTGFLFDTNVSGQRMVNNVGGSNWIIGDCVFYMNTNSSGAVIDGAGTNNTIRKCLFLGSPQNTHIYINHSSTVSNSGHLIENCICQT